MSAPQTYGYPPQGYPQAPPQYPAQQPYPQQQQAPYPPQQYPAQQFPVQQGYPQAQMAPPAAPLAQGSIDDFYNQPSTGGGKSLSFKVIGTRYRGIVTRPLGPGDIQQQTDTQQRPQFFKDGRPKFVMKVPLQIQPNAEYPDGLVVWFVKGQTRDELVRAMSEAGAPAGPPQAASIIDITYVGDRPAGAGMNPAKQFQITYTRPDGAPPAPATAHADPGLQAAHQAIQPQQVEQLPPGQYAPPAQYQQPVQQFAPPPPQQPQAPAQAAPQPPADLSAEQQALLAKLTGG